MSAAHTPWTVRRETYHGTVLIDILDATGDEVCSFSGSDEELDEAHARLMSAAPDLLACLRRMCGMYGAYSRRLAPLLAEDEGTVWTFERANSLALEAIIKAEAK